MASPCLPSMKLLVFKEPNIKIGINFPKQLEASEREEIENLKFFCHLDSMMKFYQVGKKVPSGGTRYLDQNQNQKTAMRSFDQVTLREEIDILVDWVRYGEQ